MSERLHKFLATHGFGSRRELERWIADGRITLNGTVAKTGDQYVAGDRVTIDGKEITGRLKAQASVQVLLYHKPQGQALAPDEAKDIKASIDGTVQDHLPAVRGSRWLSINPMHPGDSGLLLVTNDGALDYALTRRKRWIPAVYMVRVLAPGSAKAPPEIPPHVTYDDELVEFTKVQAEGGEGANLWYRVEVERADRRAAVRALFESRELKVSRMTQVSFGNIHLPRDLPRMRHRILPSVELAVLYELARIKQPEPVVPMTKEALRNARDERATKKVADSRGDKRDDRPGDKSNDRSSKQGVGRNMGNSAGQRVGVRGGKRKKLRGPAPDRRKPKRKS